MFADDLNSFNVFEATSTDKSMLDSMAECQESLHRWGAANRVCFDAGKEHFITLDKRNPSSDQFKLLGIILLNSLCTRSRPLRCLIEILSRVLFI